MDIDGIMLYILTFCEYCYHNRQLRTIKLSLPAMGIFASNNDYDDDSNDNNKLKLPNAYLFVAALRLK